VKMQNLNNEGRKTKHQKGRKRETGTPLIKISPKVYTLGA